MELFEMYDLLEILETGTGYFAGYANTSRDVIVELIDDPKHIGYDRISMGVSSGYVCKASHRFYTIGAPYVKRIKKASEPVVEDEEYLFPDISTL